jgi:hypothetical protein
MWIADAGGSLEKKLASVLKRFKGLRGVDGLNWNHQPRNSSR